MIVTTVNYLEENDTIARFRHSIDTRNLKFYALDLYELFQYNDVLELEIAVQRAIRACKALNLKVRCHFLPVFRDLDGQLVSDWRLSATAYRLVIINGNPSNPLVAKVQLEVLKHPFTLKDMI